jgi:hypothetical protein
MAQLFSIGLSASAVDGALYAVARLVSAALAVGVVVIGLLAAAAAPSLMPSWSTVFASTGLQPSAAPVTAQSPIGDRVSRTNDDDYLDGLVKALDRDP